MRDEDIRAERILGRDHAEDCWNNKSKLLVDLFLEDLCGRLLEPNVNQRNTYMELLREYSEADIHLEYTAAVVSLIPSYHSIKSRMSRVVNSSRPLIPELDNIETFDIPDQFGQLPDGELIVLGREAFLDEASNAPNGTFVSLFLFYLLICLHFRWFYCNRKK